MTEAVKAPPARTKATKATEATDGLRGITARFEELERSRPPGPGWLEAIRKAGIAHFAEKGFPTTKDEEWRFTNVAPIAKLPFEPSIEAPTDVSARSIEKLLIPGLSSSRLVFVDGHYVSALSSLDPELKGLRIGSLAAALSEEPGLLEAHLGRLALCESNAFVALNAAFFSDGAFLSIPAGRTVLSPIHLLFLASGSGPTHLQPRNLVVFGEGAQAKIIESYAALNSGDRYLCNSVTEIDVGPGAIAEHCKLQSESLNAFHIATVEAGMARDSRLLTHSISVGGRITRNNIHLVLDGEGIEAVLNGLYLGTGEQLIDHHTAVDHAKPHCDSHEFYHGILDGRSKGVFNGKIFVRAGAQKTDAKQTNRGLLLSDSATIDTKPQLEIFADDVKCTHGATIGQLSDEEIFYLRSRGIGLESARRILVHAFASDVINRISLEPVRVELEKLITHRLDGRAAEA